MTPRLTVVIPTYNRAAVLRRCLDALLQQTEPAPNFEVLVSDDGSTDATRAVTEEYAVRSAAEGGPSIGYLGQPNSGANAARNRAIRAARGSIILLINDDTIGVPDFIARHLAAHAAEPAPNVAVLGRVTVAPELPHSVLAALHLDRAFAAIGAQRELDWRWFFTCNVSVKREFLAAGGPFEERMRYHEDLELSERLSHFGLRVRYEPSALGYHYHFLTPEEFLGVARREAHALWVWARKSPQLVPLLAEFGFEPALSPRQRLKNVLRSWAVNSKTLPLWRSIAAGCPTVLEPLAQKLYLQMYQSVKRSHLLQLLEGAAS